MEHYDSEKMTPFDQLISTQRLQILKLLIPYTPPENQRFLAVYTKFLELQHTINFFQDFHKDMSSQDFEQKAVSPSHIFQEIRPYLPSQTAEAFDTISNMMEMMEMFQTVQETINTDENSDPAFDPMLIMKTMLDPEQQAIFDMYNTISSQETNSEPKTKNESETEKEYET